MIVAGLDGIPSGWLCVILDVNGLSIINIFRVSAINDLLGLNYSPQTVGVDIPIGLLHVSRRGGRDCDRAARRVLGAPRQSSVFPPPVRPALAATTYGEASRINASAGDGRRISRQTFGILPKIREVDAFLSPQRQSWLREVHPEISFAIMADGACRHRKSSVAGWDERRKRLTGVRLPDPLDLLKRFDLPWGLRIDLADAMAAAWSASRAMTDCAVVLPSPLPPTDSRELRMEIVA